MDAAPGVLQIVVTVFAQGGGEVLRFFQCVVLGVISDDAAPLVCCQNAFYYHYSSGWGGKCQRKRGWRKRRRSGSTAKIKGSVLTGGHTGSIER